MNTVLAAFKGEGSSFMWLILLSAIIILGLILERFYYIFLKSTVGRGNFMRSIAHHLQAGRLAEAGQLAAAQRFPLANVIAAVLINKDKGEKAIEKAVDEVFLTESPRLSRYLGLIITLANVATLLGLIGTVYGLILAFDAVGNLPAAQRPQALAKGIAVAMSTTYLGLIVAIPAMVIHGLLTMQSERLSEELEEKAVKVMNLL